MSRKITPTFKTMGTDGRERNIVVKEMTVNGRTELEIVTDGFAKVTRLSKGRYQIEPSGPILTSDDPDAP
jgi:hypothetical protein